MEMPKAVLSCICLRSIGFIVIRWSTGLLTSPESHIKSMCHFTQLNGFLLMLEWVDVSLSVMSLVEAVNLLEAHTCAFVCVTLPFGLV